MGILTRTRRLLQANLHDLLDGAEDPAKLLNYLILEMQERLASAREETAAAMAAERRLAQQADEAEQAAGQWEMRARLAVERDDDALAREALLRRAAATGLASQYQQADEQQQQAVAELRRALSLLQHRLQEAKTRRSALLAQIQVTRARQVIARSLKETMGDDAFATFDRLAGKIETERLQAIAISELSRDETEDTFILSEAQSMVERELTALKHEMGYLAAPPAPKALGEADEASQ